jgi:heme exporter protein C
MYDLDSRMRLVLYPAVLGWIIVGYWISDIRFRMKTANEHINELENTHG